MSMHEETVAEAKAALLSFLETSMVGSRKKMLVDLIDKLIEARITQAMTVIRRSDQPTGDA